MNRSFRPSRLIWVFALLGVLGVTSVSQAAVFGFTGVTTDTNPNITAGESQLRMEVTAVGTTQVKFKFYLDSDATPMSITDVYFDDGYFFSGITATSLSETVGVDFEPFASPKHLPGAQEIDFNTSGIAYTTDAESGNPGVMQNGVNAVSESLSVTVTLINGNTYADVIGGIKTALANPGVDNFYGVRVGLHVQSINGTGSESFVNGAELDPDLSSVVPEPASMTLWALGLTVCGGVGYYRKRRQAVAA